jgi:hypothetical protein
MLDFPEIARVRLRAVAAARFSRSHPAGKRLTANEKALVQEDKATTEFDDLFDD